MKGLRLDIPAAGSCMHFFVLCLCTVLCYMFVHCFVLDVCVQFRFICLCTVLFYMFVHCFVLYACFSPRRKL